jgi:transcriptional regulator with XRE-family HTH domain
MTSLSSADWHDGLERSIEAVARFGAEVRRVRESLGWSQERLAAQADLNRSYMGEVERGVVTPSLATAAKLAVALQVPLWQLVMQCEKAG